MAIGKLRNRPCPCGSNKKYKQCCWDKDYLKGFGVMPVLNKIKRWSASKKGKLIEETVPSFQNYKRPERRQDGRGF